MGLLQLLKQLFGKGYLNKIMGTRTNIAKPIRMDKDSPFRKYSDEAFVDQKDLDYIEVKLNEYGPYALSNKNPQELANFEANAKRLLQAKMRQTGTTQGMVDSMKPRPEADIIDIATQQKVDDTGIMKLKKDLGLREDIPSDSALGELLLEQGRLNKKKSIGDAFVETSKSAAKPLSLEREGQVRTASREFLNRELKLGKIKLNPNETKSILQPSGGGTDPIDILRTYYGEDVLEALDGLAPKFMQAEKYSDYLKIMDENLDPTFFKPRKDPSIKQSYTDDEMKDIVNKQEDDLADKLKDYDGDPDALANGGRPGYAFGSTKAVITFIIDTLVKKKKFDLGLLKRISGQKNGEKLLKELYEKEIGKLPLTTADKAPIPESTVTRDMFKDANERFNTKTKTPDKALLKAMDEIGGGTGDLKYDADVLADELAFQRGLIPEGGDITDIADQMKRMDLYDEAYSALSQQFLKNREIKKMQQFSKPTQTLKSIEDTGTIDISDDEIMGEFETFMRERDPEGMKPIDALVEKINLKGKKRTDNAEGGRIEFSVGGAKVIGKAGLTGFQALRDLIRNLAKERGMQGSEILKLMNYKNLASAIKSKFSKKDFDKFKLEIQKSKIEQLERFKGMFESKVKFNQSIEQGKALDDGGTGLSDIFSYMDESFSKGSPVPRNVNEEDVLKMDQLIKNQTVKDDPRKLNAQGGLNYLMGL